MGLRFRGLGHATGSRVLTNADLESMMETTAAWIEERTGITERHVCADGETCSTLAADSGREALASAGVSDVDLSIVATCTPDHLLPATAAYAQRELGLTGAAMDLNVACSGFVYGLAVADGLLSTGAMSTILLMGAEAFSPFIDWTDRGTAILFADGAGAVVLEAVEGRGDLIATDFGNDAALAELIQIRVGSRTPPAQDTLEKGTHFLRMSGREVFRAAVRVIADSSRRCLERAGIGPADVDLFVPHQANERIITVAAERLGVAPERTFVNVGRHGNTSAATIPLALYEAQAAGRLHRGDRVLLCGFGAGMSWGSAVVEWSLGT
ncbi:MAG: ketoacyl-ACP synthase III [Acidimicrobiia bacterium]|nr:ketoacyl-ACP synthase III [Acidimicrobiia bacterium]